MSPTAASTTTTNSSDATTYGVRKLTSLSSTSSFVQYSQWEDFDAFVFVLINCVLSVHILETVLTVSIALS
jgi:hypothetical protein